MLNTRPKKGDHYRQGDVLLIWQGEPKTPTKLHEAPIEGLGPILALGEATGHSHVVVAHPESYDPSKDLDDLTASTLGMSMADHAEALLEEMYEGSREIKSASSGEPAVRLYEGPEPSNPTDWQEIILVVNRPTLLRHEEHPAIGLPRGTYKVRRQREYTPEGWTRVMD